MKPVPLPLPGRYRERRPGTCLRAGRRFQDRRRQTEDEATQPGDVAVSGMVAIERSGPRTLGLSIDVVYAAVHEGGRAACSISYMYLCTKSYAIRTTQTERLVSYGLQHSIMLMRRNS